MVLITKETLLETKDME